MKTTFIFDGQEMTPERWQIRQRGLERLAAREKELAKAKKQYEQQKADIQKRLVELRKAAATQARKAYYEAYGAQRAAIREEIKLLNSAAHTEYQTNIALIISKYRDKPTKAELRASA